MVCRECEWGETGRGGGSKSCTVVACRDPSVFHSFSRCGKYFCSESQCRTVAACRDPLVCVTSPAAASNFCYGLRHAATVHR